MNNSKVKKMKNQIFNVFFHYMNKIYLDRNLLYLNQIFYVNRNRIKKFID